MKNWLREWRSSFVGVTMGALLATNVISDTQDILTTLPERFIFSTTQPISISGVAIDVDRDGRIIFAIEHGDDLELVFFRIWAQQIDRHVLKAAVIGRELRCVPMYLGADAVSSVCDVFVRVSPGLCEIYTRAPYVCNDRPIGLATLLNLISPNCSEEDRLNFRNTLLIENDAGGSTQSTCSR